MVPIGDADQGTVALHLHPGYIGWHEIAVAHIDHGELTDVAGSLASYVLRRLQTQEAVSHDE
ncbi:MAG: hypothetical protein Rubg2KO_06350 [Rubricoccaceae bacterium]